MKIRYEMVGSLPMCESKMVFQEREGRTVEVDTYGSRVHVEWDPQAAVTAMGQ